MKLFTNSFILIFLLSQLHSLKAQTINTWTRMNDFNGEAREFAFSFVVNNMAYVGTGINSEGKLKNDLWQYDPVADTWSQKNFTPGLPRKAAIAFAIGNKGYMGTGDVGPSDEVAANDFYEYDQGTDLWAQKLGVGIQGRKSASAFVIGNKGYIVGGYLKSGTSITYDSSLWEFDPSVGGFGQWTRRPNFPGIPRGSAGAFTINNIGYITGGLNITYSDPNGYGATFRDLWSYNPTTQQWSSVNSYPTSLVPSGSASPFVEGFAVGNKGYVIGTNYFLEYDPVQNSFSSKGIPSSSSHTASAAFNLCNLGYFATGAKNAVGSKNVYKYLSDQLDFTCPSIICYSNYTFSPKAMAPGSTITWTTSSNLTYVSGQGTPSFTVNVSTNGQGWIKMDVTTPCGQSYSMKHDVWLGPPALNSISIDGNPGPFPLCNSGNIPYTANQDHFIHADVGGASSVNYTLNGAAGVVSGSSISPTDFDFYSKSSSANFTINASMSNGCGSASPCLYFSNASSSCQPPQITSITINGGAWNSLSCGDSYFNYAANTWYTIQVNNNSGNPITYSASSSGVTTQSVSSNTFKVKCSNSTQAFAVHITASNSCSSTSACIWFSNSGGPAPSLSIQHGKSLQVHPNPASTSLTIELIDSLSTSPSMDQPMQVFLINRYSQTVYYAQSLDKNFQIPVSGLPTDVYYLNVFYGDAILREQIFISR